MPATVINGAFSSSAITWQSAIAGGPYKGYCVVSNPQNITVTLTGLSITGTFAGDYTIPAGQTGAVLNPGQSVIIEVDFTPGGVGLRGAALQITFSNIYFATVNLRGAEAGTQLAQPFPALYFFNVKIGQTSTYANAVIVNTATVNLTVSNLAMAIGTDFFIVGAPITPFIINAGAQSPAFSVQFTPSMAGTRNDTLNVTVGGNIASVPIAGFGSTLQSSFSMTGATQGTLFAFPGTGAGLILLANPTNLNCEEPGSLVRLHDFGIINREKQVMRIRGHYEDLGVATVTFKCRSRRLGKPDDIVSVNAQIGTVAADGWIREFASEPAPVSGELVQITISRAGNSGPVSLIDYTPQFELEGEVISGV
jgi:hypothetical protein